MKFCPLWSLFYGKSFDRKECIGEECGMYKLCNPVVVVTASSEDKEKIKKLPIFGGGYVEQKNKD